MCYNLFRDWCQSKDVELKLEIWKLKWKMCLSSILYSEIAQFVGFVVTEGLFWNGICKKYVMRSLSDRHKEL